jgi:hypothetical protein
MTLCRADYYNKIIITPSAEQAEQHIGLPYSVTVEGSQGAS